MSSRQNRRRRGERSSRSERERPAGGQAQGQHQPPNLDMLPSLLPGLTALTLHGGPLDEMGMGLIGLDSRRERRPDPSATAPTRRRIPRPRPTAQAGSSATVPEPRSSTGSDSTGRNSEGVQPTRFTDNRTTLTSQEEAELIEIVALGDPSRQDAQKRLARDFVQRPTFRDRVLAAYEMYRTRQTFLDCHHAACLQNAVGCYTDGQLLDIFPIDRNLEHVATVDRIRSLSRPGLRNVATERRSLAPYLELWRDLRGFLTGVDGTTWNPGMLERTTSPAGARIALFQQEDRIQAFARTEDRESRERHGQAQAQTGTAAAGSATAQDQTNSEGRSTPTRESSASSRQSSSTSQGPPRTDSSSAAGNLSVPRSVSSTSRRSGGSKESEGSERLWRGMFNRKRGD